MSDFTPIDLSSLPAPSVIEELSFDAIFAAMLDDLRSRDSAFTALVESDPAYKILEVAAYRELLIRQRVNDACKAVMLAFAQGADLEQLGAFYGVTRNILVPADPQAFPPIAAVYEGDTSFRRRIQLALEGFSTAGPRGAYIFHSLSVAQVKDVAVLGPDDDASINPGEVKVYVVGIEPGEVSADTISAVSEKLNADDTRPLTDQVEVAAAERVAYDITATIYTFRGPDPAVVLATINDAVAKLVEDSRVPGRDVPLSALYAALHQPGVSRVSLVAPAADLVISPSQVAEVGTITITHGGVGE
jgi:phage-related baseplate assembly protein